MKRAFLVIVFALVLSWQSFASQPTEEQPKPIAAAEAEQRAKESRDFLTDMLWLKTEDYWHEGEWDEAIRLCRQIVQVDPTFVEAYTGAAWMLWSMDRDPEAIELYEAGIRNNPKSYEVHHEYGMYFRYRQKWEQATEQFRKSVELGAPKAFQHMLPNALENGGHKREALEEWRAILRRFPDDAVAKKHIARLEQELTGQGSSQNPPQNRKGAKNAKSRDLFAFSGWSADSARGG